MIRKTVSIRAEIYPEKAKFSAKIGIFRPVF